MTNKFSDLVNIEKLKVLFESHSKVINLPFALVEYSSLEPLLKIGMTDMCTKFHYQCDQTIGICGECKEDLLSKKQVPKQINIKQCGMGPVCSSVPVIVNNELIAFLQCGQVFFEKPDLDLTRKLARKYGFNEEEYVSAVLQAPVLDEEKFRHIVEYLSNLASILANLGESRNQVQEKNQYLEALFKGINGEIYVCSEDMKIVYANDKFYKRFGDQCINHKCHNVIFHHYQQCKWCVTEDVFKHNKTLTVRLPNDIDKRWDRVSFSPIVLPDNQKVCMVILNDITEQVKKEEELYLTQYFVDNSTIATALVTPEGKFDYVNEKACQLPGYTKEEMLNMHVWDVDNDSTKEKFADFFEMMRKEKVSKVKSTIITKDKIIYPIEIFSTHLVYKDQERIISYITDISERKKYENEILDLTTKFYAISGCALDAIIIINDEGKVIYWNKAAEDILGYNSYEIIGKSLHAIIAPGRFRKGFEAGLAKFKKTGKGNAIGKTVELAAIKKDGTEISVELSLDSIKVKNEWQAVGILRDITKRKKTDEELKLTKYFVENSPIAKFLLNSEGKFIYVNKKACESLNYSEEEMFSMKIFDIDTSFPEKSWNNYWKYLKKLETVAFESTFKTKTDGVFPVSISLKYLDYQDKSYLLAYISDITERKEFEQRLLDFNKKFSAIADTALDAIIMINNKDEVIFWNKAAEEILGYRKSEIIGKSFHETIAPQRFLEAHKTNFPEFIKTGEGAAVGKTLELAAIKKDGTEIVIELSLDSIKLQNEWHAVGILRDITERKSLEEALQHERDHLEETVEVRTKELQDSLLTVKEALSHKDRFLATMSHELRTPLNGIIGYTDMLKHKYFGELNEKQTEYIDIIRNSSDHLLSLINDILDLTMIESGTLELKLENFEYSGLIDEMVSLVSTQYKEKGLSINYKMLCRELNVQADKKKLRQILLNLLTNSLKFTDSGGKVEIIVEKVNDKEIKTSVIDTGIGIKEENKEKIFDEFFKTEHSLDQAIGGTGIGLTLTKRLVELHNGKIGVESQLGTGSTFWFILPFTLEN